MDQTEATLLPATHIRTESIAPRAEWQAIIARYERSDPWRAVAQIVTTIGPLCLAFYFMYQSLDFSYWLTLLLAIPTAGFLVRTFIIMHDCAHRSFLRWPRVNDAVGMVTVSYTHLTLPTSDLV